MAGVGLPMAIGVIPPNPIFGFRAAHTLAWYDANFWAGTTAIVLGLGGAAFLLVLSRRRSISETAQIYASTGTTVFVMIAMAIAGFISS